MIQTVDERQSTRSSTSGTRRGEFPPTRWSLVVSAGENSGSALEELCRLYWPPVYAFLRRSGYSREDSEDLTQSYFLRLLDSKTSLNRDQIRGRLRSFLLGGVKRHLADHLRRQGAQKRGNQFRHLPFASSEEDFNHAESEYAAHPANDSTPDRLFEQRWALELLARSHYRLREHYAALGRTLEYELLKSVVVAGAELDYDVVAPQLKMKPATARVRAHRLRKHFRGALKEEIAETVGSQDEVEQEIAYLFSIF